MADIRGNHFKILKPNTHMKLLKARITIVVQDTGEKFYSQQVDLESDNESMVSEYDVRTQALLVIDKVINSVRENS